MSKHVQHVQNILKGLQCGGMRMEVRLSRLVSKEGRKLGVTRSSCMVIISASEFYNYNSLHDLEVTPSTVETLLGTILVSS